MVSGLLIAGAVVGVVVVVGTVALPAIRVMPYAYGSARVRAARAKLLKDEQFETFAQEGYKEVLYHLEKQGFSGLLDHIEEDFAEEAVQQTLRKEFLADVQRVLQYVPKTHQPFFKMLLMRHDLDFILAVLRSKQNEYYDRHLLQELFVQTKHFTEQDLEAIPGMSLDAFLSSLKGTPYEDMLAPHAEAIKQGNVAEAEKGLQEQYYHKLLSTARQDRALRGYAKLLIDIHNINHALCFSDKHFLPKGNLGEDVLSGLEQAQTLVDVQRVLESTHFAEWFKDVQDIAHVSKALSQAKKAYAKKLAKQEPLSISQLLAYVIEKHVEIKNVRVVLKLVHEQFAPDEIREAII